MKTVLKMLAICMMAGGLGVQSVYAEPLVIQEQGSFSAGGTIITAPGTFDAKKPLDSAGQTYHGDHASVFYQIPENPHKYPIVMLHGAGQSLSGVYGTLLPDNNLNYSVQVGNTQGGNTSSGTSGYSSLNYRGAYGNTNVGYSRSGDSSQIYYGMSGGIIAHADGITFGQPLGDTMVLVKAPGADNVKIENQTGIHTDWRGYAILPFATEYRENRVALNANSLADNVELDETVVTVIPTHGAIARATFNAKIGGKVLMTLKYGNKSVPFGAIVTHGENKNGSIVAENGQVYLTGLPQSGKLQVSWGNDKNSNCIVDYKLPVVSPGTLLNQQTAICR